MDKNPINPDQNVDPFQPQAPQTVSPPYQPQPYQPEPQPVAPPPPSAPEEYKSRKIKWTYLLIVLLAIIVLALLGFIYIKENQPSTPAPTPTPEAKTTATPTPEATSSADTSDWKEFKTLTYTFKYPSEWEPTNGTLAPKSPIADNVLIYKLPRTEGIEVPVSILNTYAISMYNSSSLENVEKLSALPIGGSLQITGTKYTRVADSLVGGEPAQNYDGTAVPGYPAETVQFTRKTIVQGSNTYTYEFEASVNSLDDTDPSLMLFNDLLSTISFNK